MQTWQGILSAGLLAVVGALLIAPGSLPLIGVLSGVLLVVFVYRNMRNDAGPARTPWMIIAVGAGLTTAGVVTRAVEGAITGVAYPFPSVADLLIIAGYSVFVFGTITFVRKRTREKRLEDWVDAVIVGLLVTLFLYLLAFGSYIQQDTVGLGSRALNLAYFGLTIALATAIARVSFGPGERNTSYYLLAAGTLQILGVDVLVNLDLVGHTWATGVAAVVSIGAFVSVSASVAHPGATLLADPLAYEEERLGTRRIALLMFSLLLGPLVLAARMRELSGLDAGVVATCSVLLAGCVVARTVLLIKKREDRTDRERSLRELGNVLVSAQDQPAMLRGAQASLDAALGGINDVRHGLFRVDGRELVALTQHDPWRHTGGLNFKDLSKEVRIGIQSGHLKSHEEVSLLSGSGRSAYLVTAPIAARRSVPMVILVESDQVIPQERVAAIESVAGQLGLALDSLEAAEEAHQRRFRALVENSSDLLVVLDENDHVSFVSPNVERVLGWLEGEIVNNQLERFVHEPDQNLLERLLAWARSMSPDSSLELRLLDAAGDPQWFEVEASDLTDADGIGGVLLTARNVADRKRAENKLLRSESRFRLMVQHSSDVVAVVDADNMLTYVSPSIERMMDIKVEHVLGRNVFEMLSVTEAERVKAMAGGPAGSSGTLDVRLRAGDGTIRAIEVSMTDMLDEPDVAGVVLSMRDVSDRRKLEDSLRHQALHDDLTGLANRTLFTDRVRDALAAGNDLRAVLFLDLDDFKLINDSLGHVVGDQVLVTVADRIQQCLRLTDTAARLGGDEFAVLLTDVYGESEVEEITNRIRHIISEPIDVSGHSLRLTSSVGIALSNDPNRTGQDLLRLADLAMYQAKNAGKDRFQTFEAYMETSASEQLGLKTALLRAVENNEFVVHYQPIFDVNHGRTIGVEALVRWDDPERGLISPAAFIGAAEETGLINQIGNIVTTQALADLTRWRDSGFDIYCTINVSGRQFQEVGFAEKLVGQIEASAVDPSQIVVELTESLLVLPNAAQIFTTLRNSGIRIAIDDFGTGYSALQYLQNFNIDLIKIDRAFVTALGETGDPGVVQAVLDVASSIGAKTVAEGIEHTIELKRLKKLGVELGQGYYFCRPVPEPELRRVLLNELTGRDVPVSSSS